MSINSVCISGNLTRDPELRDTASGSKVLGLGVAVNERRKNQQTGEWEDAPCYVDVTVFGRRAEALAGFLRKGMKVAVKGRLRYHAWEAKDGTRRSRLDVACDEMDVMVRRGEQGASTAPAAPAAPAASVPPAHDHVPADLYDEGIPF